MAHVLLCLEIDSLDHDFPWDEMDADPLLSKHYTGIGEDEQLTDCQIFMINGDMTVNEAGRLILDILTRVEKLRGLRFSEDDWWVQMPTRWLGKDSFSGEG